jgi:hypothetical protein
LEYLGIRQPGGPRPSGGKPLSEIISALFICSDRFRRFPSSLREDVLTFLDKFEVFDRQKICVDIQKALNKLFSKKKSGKAFVVPFTMNSGHLVMSYLRDSVRFPDDTWVPKDSLRAALADFHAGDWIVFVDDHAASGTQVSRRLSQWVRGGAYGGDSKLELLYLEAFRKAKIAFAFAAMAETGKTLIENLGRDLTLGLAEVAYGVPFQEYSLREDADKLPELREFLSLVGTGLMLPRFKSGRLSFQKVVSQARQFR